MALSKQLTRFDDISDDELEDIRHGLASKNTNKSNKKCETLLQAYLIAKKKDPSYWLYDEPTLDQILGKFWFEVRTKKGDKYTVSNLKHLRYG